MYKHSDSQGLVEVEDYFTSETMDLFTQTTILDFPSWVSAADNDQSQVLGSLAVYTQASQSSAGSIDLIVKQGLLPVTVSSWYLGYEHDNEAIEFKTGQASDDLTIIVPLGQFSEDQGQMLLAALDSTTTSTSYNLKVCGSFSNPTNPTLARWPVRAYLMQTN
jgi:hypothetical protein